MRRHAIPLAARAVILAALLGAPTAAQRSPAGLVPASLMSALDRGATELAKRSRLSDVETLVDVMVRLGLPAEQGASRKKALASLVPKKKPRRPKDTRGLVRQLRAAARKLVRFLEKTPPTERRRRETLARAILAIHDSVESAHQALGHVAREGAWVSPEMNGALDRRKRFLLGLQKARQLEVTVETRMCRDPAFATLGFPEVAEARFRQIRIFANIEPALLGKLMREGLRGFAFGSFVRTGRLALPPKSVQFQYLYLRKHEDYLRAIKGAARAGWLSASAAARAPDELDFRLPSERTVGKYIAFSYAFSNFLFDVSHRTWRYFDYGGVVPPCLYAGHLNWTCLSYLGVPLPTIGVVGNSRVGRPPRYAQGGASAEWKEAERAAGAGISGSRSWIEFLARRSLDPSWSHAMVDQVGKITGDTLLRTTFVAEYLQETDALGALMKSAVKKGKGGDAAGKDAILQSIGEPLARFEARWRRWLLPQVGIVQRLARGKAKPDKSLAAAVRYVNELRAAAWDKQRLGARESVVADETLSRGCLAHARYLNRHPTQAAKWPDAHEEYPDKAGFSVAGNRAGLHSVIAPGTRGPREAIDAWMGTFYHRLPLLEAGLIRIGSIRALG